MRTILLIALCLTTATATAQDQPAASAESATAAVPAGSSISPALSPATGPVISQSDRAFMHEEARLLRETRLLELKAKIADLQQKVNGSSAQVLPRVDSTVPAAMPLQLSSEAFMPSSNASPFRVLAIYGRPGDYAADINSGGIRIAVHVGSGLPDAWRVVHIAPTAVTVAKGKRRETLELRL